MRRLLVPLLATAWLFAQPVAAAVDPVPIPPGPKPTVPASALLLVDRPLTVDEQNLKLALGFYRSGHTSRARSFADKVRDPLASKILRWLDMTKPGSRASFEQTAEFLGTNPDWPYQNDIQRLAETKMPADLPDDEVIAWFGLYPALSPEGTSAHADALLRGGRTAEAVALIRRSWVELDFTRDQERDYRKRFNEHLRVEDEWARLDRLLWDRQRYAAQRQAKRLGGGYPALADARLRLAFRNGAVDNAINRVPRDLKTDPGLIYERANWRRRKGRTDGVLELMAGLPETLPQPERWWALREWSARRALETGDATRAYELASRHGLESGLGFAEGEWLAGWIALRRLDRPRDAYLHFAKMFDGVNSPLSKSRAAYWAGEAALAIDKPDYANRWHLNAAVYNTTFYGQLATQRLGKPLQVPSAPFPEPGTSVRQDFESRDLVRIIRLLGRMDEHRLQKIFFIRLRAAAATPSDFALAARLAEQVGRPDLAIRIAKSARHEGVILPNSLYPTIPLSGQSPEVSLVLSVIRQESAFYTNAVSGAGARGLMQLMPRTARNVARSMKLPYSSSDLTADPDYNLRLGRAYLSRLVERFEGSYILALAAYNAGPTRAQRWMKANGDPRDPAVDPVDWIEAIPFSETRNYVQRILEGLAIYRQMLRAEQTTWILRPQAPAS